MDGHIAKIDGDFWTFEGKRKAKLMFLGFNIFCILYLNIFDQNCEFSQNKNKIWH